MALSQINGLGQTTFARVTVPQAYPNVEISNNPAGTHTINQPGGGASVSTVTFAPNGSTALPEGKAADLFGVVIWSPVDADGSTPDVTITFNVGAKPIRTLYLQGGHTHNMMPPHHAIVGGYAQTLVKLGVPMRQVYDWLRRGKSVTNVPLMITGIKLPSDTPLVINVTSQAGWGQNGSAVQPLEVDVLGDLWDDSELAAFQALYAAHNGFAVSRPPFATVRGFHTLPAPLSAKSMGQLPGGESQAGATTINRKIIFASNAVAIGSNGQFVYSNLPSVGGAQQSIANTFQDMGDAFAAGKEAFIWEELGFRFAEDLIGGGDVPQLYVGMYINSKVWPDFLDHGVLISATNNQFEYGMVRPQQAGGTYWALKKASRLLSLVSYQNSVAPVVSASGLTALGANTVTAVKGGTLVAFNA